MVCHEDVLVNIPKLLPQLIISYYDIVVFTSSIQLSNMGRKKWQ
jgi:hypothetical protein